MRLRLLALLPAGLLAGCAGYALDYVKPKASLIAPELARYGLDAAQTRCVGDRLTTGLSVWQLRQLARSAGAVTKGYSGSARLGFSDLAWVARHVSDPKVAQELGTAAGACGLNVAASTVPAGAAPPPAPPAPPPAPAREAAPAASAAWVNLGAAPTGQSIAIEAASMSEGPSYRQAWFRVTEAGSGKPSRASYLLRIDCAAKTINPMALRKHGSAGALEEQRDYGPTGEGAMPVEGGTVMEIAYLALCT